MSQAAGSEPRVHTQQHAGAKGCVWQRTGATGPAAAAGTRLRVAWRMLCPAALPTAAQHSSKVTRRVALHMKWCPVAGVNQDAGKGTLGGVRR
jgi:hypothetical protein